jgi:hypothetical protein
MWAWKMLIVGLVFILARLYTTWDIWVVIGVLMIIKALMMFMMPVKKQAEDMPKKRR